MPPDGKAVAAAVREQRLKLALKANMARRKAQAKARGASKPDAVANAGSDAAAAGVRTSGADED